jgi:hypothetical protein
VSAVGVIANLARPGRQRHRLYDLRIRLEREMAGTAQTDRAVRDASGGPADQNVGSGTSQFAAIQAVAPSLNVEYSPIGVRNADQIERAVAAFACAPNGGLIVTSGTRQFMHREFIIALAKRGGSSPSLQFF